MQNLATTQPRTDASPASEKHFSAAVVLSILFLAGLWFVLCKELSGEWSVNEQYNFGWFVPFFAIYLFLLRWQDRPQIRGQKSEVRSQKKPIVLVIGLAALLLLLPVRLFEIANPEWRLLAWVHAAAVVTLTLVMIWFVGGPAGAGWVRHFAFPVAFIFVAVPWPTVIEVPIIQGLMRMVAGVAAETAMLLGIPAQIEGNLIRVSNGLVGVNEACSGIRSLQTSLMIGLLFGELKRLSVLRRVALVAGAVAIALFANFFRAVFLVAIAATNNISEVSHWHDIAGYTIVALVFVSTMGLAYLLGRKKRTVVAGVLATQKPSEGGPPAESRTLQPTRLPLRLPVSWLAAAICWLLLVEIGTAAWYRVHETNLVSGARWSVQWPEQAPNFRKLRIDPEIRGVLRYDEGLAAAWTIMSTPETTDGPVAPATAVKGSTPNAIACYLYVFRWKPGRNSALLANLHRPDVCLPASGWTQIADDAVKNYPVDGLFELPFRHFEFRRAFDDSTPQVAHAFYSLSEDRGSGDSTQSNTSLPSMSGNRSEWTRTERLRTVLEGRRHLGQQVIEVILSGSAPFFRAKAESHLRDLVSDGVVLHEVKENK